VLYVKGVCRNCNIFISISKVTKQQLLWH